MRRLNLDQLQTFLVVAETGNFSEAGRRLNLTQSAVSQQIKELEARLGVRVLDRLGKTAHPTPAGETLRAHARGLIEQSDLVVEAMRLHRDGGWGRVRLATSAPLAAYVLPPLLLGLRKRYPKLEVTVVAGPTPDMLRRVATNEADLGFINGPTPVTDNALAIDVVTPSGLLAFWPKTLRPPAGPVRPAAFAHTPFIFYTPENLNHVLVHDWFRKGGIKPATAMEFDSGLTIVALVEAGLGASILPGEVLEAAAASGKIAVRQLDPPIPSELYVAVHKDKPLSEALRVVHAALMTAKIASPRTAARSKAAKGGSSRRAKRKGAV